MSGPSCRRGLVSSQLGQVGWIDDIRGYVLDIKRLEYHENVHRIRHMGVQLQESPADVHLRSD